MSDEARGNMDIRMQQDMWTAFCGIVKWSLIGIVILLALMAVFLV